MGSVESSFEDEDMPPSRYEEIMRDKPYEPFDKGGSLTEAMIEKAQKELGETEEVKARIIPELRQLIKDEPDLNCPTDDAYLLQYLRPRQFKVKRAFSLLKNYYEVKKTNADMYGSFNREALKRMYDQKAIFILPYRDDKGCAILVIKMRNWNIDVTNAEEAVTAFTTAVLMCAEEPATQVCGIRILVDVRGATMRQMLSLRQRHVELFAKALKNSMPLRFKGIHLYNNSTTFQLMWSLLKTFMSEKMKNRIHLHGDNRNDLHRSIPKDILPAQDFGGRNPNDVAAWFNEEVEKYLEIYRQLTTYGYRK